MDKQELTTEIKKLTELLRQSTPEKKGEIEKKLVELYFELYRIDAELATKGNIVDKISKIKMEKTTNWALKVKALEELIFRRYDVIVALLDGTKLPKEQVPAGEFYINEKGQKCRKVLKVVPVQKTQEAMEKGRFDNLSKKVSTALVNGSNQLIKVSKTAIGKIGEKSRKAKASASSFMDSMMDRLIEKMQLDKTIKSLELYQKENGKDVHDLIDFLKKIQESTKK